MVLLLCKIFGGKSVFEFLFYLFSWVQSLFSEEDSKSKDGIKP